jgi:hypothetical protein
MLKTSKEKLVRNLTLMRGKKEPVEPTQPLVYQPLLEIKLYDKPRSILDEKLLTQHHKMQSDLKQTLINCRAYVPSFSDYMDPLNL